VPGRLWPLSRPGIDTFKKEYMMHDAIFHRGNPTFAKI